jgi:hypothetical protein
MSDPALFKWRHFEAEIILCAVHWYLRYTLSYRDVAELLRERGVGVDHMRQNWTSGVDRSSKRPIDAPCARHSVGVAASLERLRPCYHA